jgi:hypothetical protein
MAKLTNSSIHGSCLLGAQMSEYSQLLSVFFKNPGFIPGFYANRLPGMFGLLLNIPFIHKPNIFPEPYTNINILREFSELDINKDYDIQFPFNYKNFHEYRETLIEIYRFLPEIYSTCNKWIDDNCSSDETTVSIHFRRGDYLTISSLNLSLDYFYEAVEYIKSALPDKKLKFICFSNDIYWVKENFTGIDNMIFVESLCDYEQLCLMTLCDHNIIANSSYSWWGAYLNTTPGTITVCPKSYGNADTISYFPDDWVRMKSI